ncbi:MAG: roadblock/LC7 domain-containing protein [Candidatus Eremiobacteraeota bacterium]|nr:roadblock/LC7 domain-containing protein [Candidatus Eremiobacteraeota bacterium]
MELSRLRLPIKIEPQDEQAVLLELRKNFPFVIGFAKNKVRESLGLERIESEGEPCGELFCSESGIIFYLFIPRDRTFVECGCLTADNEGVNLFNGFKNIIRNTLLPGRKEDESLWEPYRPVNENFTTLKTDAMSLVPSSQDITAVEALQDEPVRRLLKDMEKSQNCFLEELEKSWEKDELTEYIEMLVGLGLVNREFYVYCRDTNRQISRVLQFSAIQEASSRGLKCPHCARILSDERIDQKLFVTAFGKRMTKPNFWLALHVLQLFSELHVDTENILVKEEKDFRVMDILVNQEQHLIFLEVKDSPATIDEVFLFHSRISYYRPDLSVLITASPLPREAKLYLKKHSDLPIVVLEGTEKLKERLSAILQRTKADYLRDVIASMECSTCLNIEKLISHHFIDKELSDLKKKLFGEEAQEEAAPPLPPSAPLPPEPVIFKEEQQQQEEPVEEDELLIEEVIPISTSNPFIAIEEERADSSASHVLIDEFQAEENGLSLEEETKPYDEGSLEALEAGEEKASVQPAEQDQFAGEGFLEEQMEVEFQTDIQRAGEIPQEELLADESREQVVERAIAAIEESGLEGRAAEIQDVLNEFLTQNGTIPVLASSEGLVILSPEGNESTVELVAALSSEIARSITSSFTDARFDAPKSIYVSQKKGLLFLFPLQEMVLALVEPLKESSSEEDLGQLQGATELRDTIMKKVLEDLGRIDGVIGSLVVSRDGLPIDFIFSDDRDIDLLSSVCSQVFLDNEKHLARFEQGGVKQLCVTTDEALYSLIPLDGEGIFISVLSPQVPKEVWKARLSSSAMMITSVFV